MSEPLLPITQKDQEKKVVSLCGLSKGMQLALLNSIFLVVLAFMFKLVYIRQIETKVSMTSFEIQFFKSLFELTIFQGVFKYLKMEANINKIDRREKNQVTIVAAAGCLGNYLAIAGIENVYLAIASLLNNTFPIFVILVAFFMLKERLTRNQVMGISFALIGMVLMSLSSLNSE